MNLFGKVNEKPSSSKIREWNSILRKEYNKLDRQIINIRKEEQKVINSLKNAAKRKEVNICIMLAKEIVKARKHINRIHTVKAQVHSVQMTITQQLSTLRLTGTLEKSANIMENMSNLVKVSEIAHVMHDVSREMMKAGIIEEMLEETMDIPNDDDEDLEEEAEEEVDKVLWEVTAGILGKSPTVVTDSLPTSKVEKPAPSSSTEQDDTDMKDMQERLKALKS